MSVPVANENRDDSRKRWRGWQISDSRTIQALRRRRRQLYLTAFLTGSFVLFVALIGFLLFSPKRTPFVVIRAGTYTWPFPPHAWSDEDLSKMSVLDGKTITIQRLEKVTTRPSLQDVYGNALSDELARNSDVAVVYVSVHGVVDQTGAPCLSPPDASPYRPDSWVKLEDFLNRLCDTRPARPTLLILDCNRILENWNLGLLDNRFSAGLQELWENNKSTFQNVAILIAASQGERAWSSPDLQGSVFGHYLRHGLAGDADRHVATGNRDGSVSLRELHAYLQTRVNAWAQYNRGTSQRPMLLAAERSDFKLTRSLNQRALDQLLETDAKLTRHAANLATDKIDGLWRQLDTLRVQRLYQREPLAWRDLQHRLLWLEQLAVSGVGYRDLALRTFDRLERQLQTVQQRVTSVSQNRTIGARCGILSGSFLRIPPQLRVHTLPLADYFGTMQPELTDQVRTHIDEFTDTESPHRADVENLLESLAALDSVPDLAERRFLHMVRRYQFPGLWEHPQRLMGLIDLRDRLEAMAVPREKSGLPSDERAHYWVRSFVAAADISRRKTEDRLFIDAQPLFDQYLLQANKALDQTVKAEGVTVAATETRDQAWAEALYFAQWLTQRGREPQLPGSREAVLSLIAETRRLAELIANHAPLQNEQADELMEIVDVIDSSANLVREKMADLASKLQTEYEELEALSLDGGLDVQQTKRLEAALAVPFIPWETRRVLRRQYARLATNLRRSFNDSNAEKDGPEDGQPLEGWSQHPVLAIFEPEERATHQHYIGDLLQDLLNKISDRAASPDSLFRRQHWSNLEHKVRAAAPIWFPTPRPNPIEELRSIDLQQLLVWHAQRTIGDFWGPAGAGSSFFDVAASDYLQAVDLLFSPASVSTSVSTSEPRARLEVRRAAARGLISVTAEPDVLLDGGDNGTCRILVTQQGVSTASDAPQGTATLLVRHADERLAGTRFELVPEQGENPVGAVPLMGVPNTFELTVDAVTLTSAGLDLQAEAAFRGHEYRSPLTFQKLGGTTVDLQPHVYEQSQVTLNSPWDKLSVVFVLDCSQSMGDPIPGAGAEDASNSRLDMAKNALQRLLLALAVRNNVRVGVRYFGHRLGWSTDEPVRVLVQPDYAEDIPAELTPNRDVEEVLALSRFTLDKAHAVLARLGGVRPWGQSPVYRSLAEALADFTNEGSGTDTHIVVITDGANYEFRPSGQTFDTENPPTSSEDVARAWQQRPVPIHIIGLGMNRDESASTIDEFTRLSEKTGGRYFAINRSTDLVQTLKELLDPGTYRVLGWDKPEIEAVLGKPIETPVKGDGIQPHFVVFEEAQEELWLEGGETMQLYVSTDGRSIHAYPYEENVAARDVLVASDGQPTDFVVRAHRPVRRDRHAVFSISWQRLDQRRLTKPGEHWRATPRPSQIWVEITPRLPGGKDGGPTYFFYDTDYQPDQPVPVMQLVTRDWPRDADSADIRLWCTPLELLETPQLESGELLELLPPANNTYGASRVIAIPLRQFVNRPAASPDELPIEVSPGIRAHVNWRRDELAGTSCLRFVEIHAEGSLGVGSLKVEPPNIPGVRPNRIVRQFDAARGIAAHWFYYDDLQADLIERSSQADILVTPRADVLANAWRLEKEPIVVRLSEPGTLLPVLSGSNTQRMLEESTR